MPWGVGLVFIVESFAEICFGLVFTMSIPFSKQWFLKSEQWPGLLYVILTEKVICSLDRVPLTSPRRNNEQPLALSCHFKPRLPNGLPERLTAPTRLPHGEELGKESKEKRKDPVRVHGPGALSTACLFRLSLSCLAALSNLFA